MYPRNACENKTLGVLCYLCQQWLLEWASHRFPVTLILGNSTVVCTGLMTYSNKLLHFNEKAATVLHFDLGQCSTFKWLVGLLTLNINMIMVYNTEKKIGSLQPIDDIRVIKAAYHQSSILQSLKQELQYSIFSTYQYTYAPFSVHAFEWAASASVWNVKADVWQL